jgi:hypothetical protein
MPFFDNPDYKDKLTLKEKEDLFSLLNSNAPKSKIDSYIKLLKKKYI